MGVRLLAGHVLDRLAELPAGSVHCVVTSPPYWGLRDYKIPPQVWGGNGCAHEWGDEQVKRGGGGQPGEKVRWQHIGEGIKGHPPAAAGAFCRRCGAWRGSLGLEPEPALYVEHVVEVFRAVRRVLRKDGSLWLNIGDSYAAQPGQRKETDKAGDKQRSNTASTGTPSRCVPGIKPKDMIGIPWMLAFALRDDGWWLRSEITWAKRAPMPESCTDRPTMATEKVFLLAKSARYFYDAEAVKEDSETNDPRRPYTSRGAWDLDGRPEHQRHGGEKRANVDASKRNLRNFWLLGPSPFPEAHFATFPPEVPRRAILAGTSARGVCSSCGAPWARVTETRGGMRGKIINTHFDELTRGAQHGASTYHGDARKDYENQRTETLGWRATCRCAAGEPIAATVLDPFLGAGTTALVADRLGRNCIGIELSPDYVAMGERRLRADAPLFLELAAE